MSWKCVDCGKETNSVTMVCHTCQTGRCRDCQRILNNKMMPPPRYNDMDDTKEPLFENYKHWPHRYVPGQCPYCLGKLKATNVGVDTSQDEVYNAYTCEPCAIFFGVAG